MTRKLNEAERTVEFRRTLGHPAAQSWEHLRRHVETLPALMESVSQPGNTTTAIDGLIETAIANVAHDVDNVSPQDRRRLELMVKYELKAMNDRLATGFASITEAKANLGPARE